MVELVDELLVLGGWSLLAAGWSLLAAGWLLEVAGWLLDVVESADAEASPEIPSAESVCGSRLPEPDRPCADWKLCSAAWVFGPILPSIAPGS